MSAGTGVQHSEFNLAEGKTTHFLQIWIEPNVKGIAPGYEQKMIPETEKRGKLRLVAAPDGQGAEGAVAIHADARIYAGLFDGAEGATLALSPNRKTYVHLVTGQLEVNGQVLTAGDAVALESENQLQLSQGRSAEVLVFDLAP
jgi:quercetin 2,3-dioxygenase